MICLHPSHFYALEAVTAPFSEFIESGKKMSFLFIRANQCMTPKALGSKELDFQRGDFVKMILIGTSKFDSITTLLQELTAILEKLTLVLIKY